MEKFPTSKVRRSTEAFLEIGFKLTGVYITYLAFNFCGEFLFEGEFNSDTLFSLLMLPALYVLKTAHVIVSPYFVKVRMSETEVESRTGILTQRLDKLNLKTVENIEVVTTLGGRLFKYSTIYLYAHGSWVRLPFLKNPDQIKLKIEAKLNTINGN
ncbi:MULTISPECIES: PH domain-containing protein [unclassified Colwellia]|uniref:PH domain-containing protein n=1 Tax=unclassified Colwellia TaxID=196834 RepID=UPI0015F6ED25|nr:MULTISPECIES: PH domain-containing protein [unclassified Colwellia]MBA6377686.1 PH domain-containing protein [Colwellia sp. BRX10-7]MBA6385354.1 PH domain-containing protein [Colwellia sp. BRX10-2]MBA6400271.1 PH domain-containing protein [Colwellia sp. BRX10-5]MBA6404150.1 PH domain-containing protein [Colwellia sp. BRX10-1]